MMPLPRRWGSVPFVEPIAMGELEKEVLARADLILEKMRPVVSSVGPELLVIQNAWAIPMQLPLAVAIARLVDEQRVPVVSHNHDYWWERTRFAENCVADLLNTYFPYHTERVVHLCINSEAQRQLHRRRDIKSLLLPNVLDFANEPTGIDDFNRDFRQRINLEEDRILFLQPTRVVPRKGIELAVDLCAQLSDLNPALVITHHAGDEGLDYLEDLKVKAEKDGVDFRYVANAVDQVRGKDEAGNKIYSLWDAYPHSNFVTYPSLYEGFGNALLEAIWFRCPTLVNRYSVYVDDIGPKGFSFVEIEGRVTDAAVAQVKALLAAPDKAKEATDKNYELAREHFSYEALERVMNEALNSIGLKL